MHIPKQVTDYLSKKAVNYDVIAHAYTQNSIETAVAAGQCCGEIAKSVLLKDDQGYMLAVLPADRLLDLGRLNNALGRNLEMTCEAELADVFSDCRVGAVPPVASAYGVQAVVDNRLKCEKEIYFEAGDHEALIHTKEADFEMLMGDALYFDFSKAIE